MQDPGSAQGSVNNVDEFWSRQGAVLRASYVNMALILVNILVFVYSIFAGDDLYDRFALDSMTVYRGSGYYRLVTSMFMHANLEHIFSNMIILLFIGANVEYDLGHLTYAFLYFFSGIVGNVASVYADAAFGKFAVSIGASGAVFGVVGAVVIIVFFGRKYLKARRSTLMARLAVMVIFSVNSGLEAKNIDNAAHLGGLTAGILFTLFVTIICRKEYTMEEWL